jgi:hypothetical protein
LLASDFGEDFWCRKRERVAAFIVLRCIHYE